MIHRHTKGWLLALCLYAGISVAQILPHGNTGGIPSRLDTYFKETLNTRDGLPHNTINAMAHTADGYIWFATWEGVARYNGREFKIFDRNPQTGLPDVGIRTFHLDHHNRLWIAGSRGGLVQVSGTHYHRWGC